MEATSVTTSTTSGKIEFSGKAMSQCKLTVTAGVGVRVCRLDAYRDGVLYDTMYVARSHMMKMEIFLIQNCIQRFGEM